MATWQLDTDFTHLNHGSFGAAPVEVLARQAELRSQMETNPVSFMLETYQSLLEIERARLAEFVGADADGLVFVPNATYGVNSVLRSWESKLGRGDEIIVTDHGYNACRQAVEVTAARTGATIVVAEVPFPIDSSETVTQAILDSVTDRTALVMIDHVTSPTAVVFPAAEIVAALEPDVPVLVDGAHAPGMLPVDLAELGASFYTANCHKWLCAPKGAAFLHVAERHRYDVEAVSISHGHNDQWHGSSGFHGRFDWTGTDDPTARLTVSTALDTMAAHHAAGWEGIRKSNHALVLAGRDVVAVALGTTAPVPDSLVGSIAALRLPTLPNGLDLAARLRHDWQIEVPCPVWPEPPQRLIRVSAQQYNELGDYHRLAEAITTLL